MDAVIERRTRGDRTQARQPSSPARSVIVFRIQPSEPSILHGLDERLRLLRWRSVFSPREQVTARSIELRDLLLAGVESRPPQVGQSPGVDEWPQQSFVRLRHMARGTAQERSTHEDYGNQSDCHARPLESRTTLYASMRSGRSGQNRTFTL